MNFRWVTTLAGLVSLPFGLGFLLAPELAGSIYGVSQWSPGTVAVGRLYGATFLFLAVLSFAVRNFSDPDAQKTLGLAFFVNCLVAGGLCAVAAITGAMNPLIWSGVAIYVFFAVAWARLMRA
ncbi:MAG: hypothetical protein WCH44_15415 [Betaproteobacteria bacterium]